MYLIKSTPKDFIVNEIADFSYDYNGNFTYCILKKKNYNTLDAIIKIANYLRIPLNGINFCGTKDKIAITRQYISIDKRITPQKINAVDIKDISLFFMGYSDKRLYLGAHQSNAFRIVVRDADFIPKVKPIINYFGKQRFSKHNAKIGKSIIKKEIKEAVRLILEGDGGNEEQMRAYLHSHSTQFYNALLLLPPKLIKLYIHSYQSLIWNETVKQCIALGMYPQSVPLVGFDTTLGNDEVSKIILTIYAQEGIQSRDWIIKSMPHFSIEGDKRNMIVDLYGFSISEIDNEKDVLSQKNFTLQFILPKGSYATVALEQILSDN